MRFVIALSLLLIVSPTLAATPEEDRATARVLFNEGLDLRNAGDHQGALAKFKAADATFTTPKIRLELAREHIALGELVEALQVLRALGNGDDDKYAAVRAEATTLESDLDTRIPRLMVIATGAPRLMLDGKAIPPGIAQPVNPGRHVVVMVRDGKEERRDVDLTERSAVTIRFDAKSVTPRSASMPTPTIVLLAAGGGALLVGGAFAWSAQSVNRDSRSHCGFGGEANACDGEGIRLRESAGARADVATVTMIAGGIAIASALAVWAWSPRDDGKKTTVSLGLGYGFAQVNGSF